jgi:hypothetical protein
MVQTKYNLERRTLSTKVTSCEMKYNLTCKQIPQHETRHSKNVVDKYRDLANYATEFMRGDTILHSEQFPFLCHIREGTVLHVFVNMPFELTKTSKRIFQKRNVTGIVIGRYNTVISNFLLACGYKATNDGYIRKGIFDSMINGSFIRRSRCDLYIYLRSKYALYTNEFICSLYK